MERIYWLACKNGWLCFDDPKKLKQGTATAPSAEFCKDAETQELVVVGNKNSFGSYLLSLTDKGILRLKQMHLARVCKQAPGTYEGTDGGWLKFVRNKK